MGRTGFEPVTSSVSSLKERGRVKRGFTGLLPVFPAVAGMPDWPAGLVEVRPGAWRSLFPDSCRSWVSGRVGQGPGGAWPASPAPLGVLDAPGREPIIGRRGTGGCAVVAAGPMGSSGAGAPGCGHPSGWPAARGRGAWGWSARAAGSIRSTATPRGAGARHGGDHALPAAGPAHPASCCAVRAVRDLTCPSRIA